jgi:hypothetical protein
LTSGQTSFVDNEPQGFNTKGKRSLDFKSHESTRTQEESNKENRRSQLVPKGDNLDVSFVAPLDQSINEVPETDQPCEAGTAGLKKYGDHLSVAEKKQLDNCGDDVISDVLLSSENVEARKRNSAEQPTESDTGNCLNVICNSSNL